MIWVMMIEFSIITVTKNNLEGLKRTAHSIQNQSHRNFEWIIVDGNSMDGSVSYIQDLNAISIIEEDNGIYDAMNKGIDKAHGDYIIFMNAGDRLSDADILRSLSALIFAEEPDFIYGDALETNGFYKKARGHTTPENGMFTHHQAMIYKREMIGDLRYDTKFEIAADYDFTVKILKRSRRVSYIPAAICIFEKGGLSHKKAKTGRLEEFLIRKKMGVPKAINIKTSIRQLVASGVKTISPHLYFAIRR